VVVTDALACSNHVDRLGDISVRCRESLPRGSLVLQVGS